MRCIETNQYRNNSNLPLQINYNMRCIETEFRKYLQMQHNDKLQHEMY